MSDNMDHALEKAADILFSARLNADAIDELPSQLRPNSIERSYLLQDCLNQKLAASAPGKPVGYKIGCTTNVMQSYLKIPHPCAGTMFESTLKRNAGVFGAKDLCRPGVECEIAIQIETDMTGVREYSVQDCDHYVGAAMASIELVDDRWIDYTSVSTPTLIADNFFSAGCVVGDPVRLNGDQLVDVTGSLSINQNVIGSGSGADILGHPYAALCWLASHQAKQGRPLRAGDYVSLGSVVQTQWLMPGDVVDIEFTALGKCSLTLTQ